MLTLLKLLPSFRKNVNKKPRVENKGENVFDKLVLFIKSNNSLEDLLPSEFPILIAIGPVKNTILQFVIRIDDQLLPTKTNCTSVDAFDTLFKFYKVFDCEYDWELKTFFNFLQYFVYEQQEEIELTTRQKEIWKLISASN